MSERHTITRHCYCPLKRQPEDLPTGFCGKCEKCGKPGHVSHYPGPMPYTGSWCEEHYLEEANSQTMRKRYKAEVLRMIEERGAT